MNFKSELNEKQYEAVTSNSQYTRVVAGAGSGKTRVLTYRIAYLLGECNVRPWNILAITFTNKVAKEMQTRVNNMVPNVYKDLTIRTFHSFAAFFLRHEINVINFPASFTIFDEEDQTKLIKDIASDMGFKKRDRIVGLAMSYIASCKLREKYPDDIGQIIKPRFEDEKTCLEIYTRYEEEKNKSLALDFDDLLLKTNYILDNFPDIRIKWQNKFQHILIDEFQDTNDTEYRLIKHLMNRDTSLYVVGDPDQTIYTWRGANQRIILDLEKDFPSIETITLERNYRSTQNILNSANKLIANNKLRLKKNLYTENNPGGPILVKSSPSGKSEADFVAREIKRLVETGEYSYNDIAILYRSNYVTLDFESTLTARNIPFKIYGGQKFYQRREIKDVLAYFHLISNIKDNLSFERIMNVPRRGVSDNTIIILKTEADSLKMSLYEYISSDKSDKSIAPQKAVNSLRAMVKLIDIARDDIAKNEEVFSKILEDLIWSLGYQEYLLKDDDGEERLENVKALFEDIRHYLKNNPESSFDEYLQNIALLSAQDEIIDGEFVTMMTVHTAKGLEYPVVFIIRFNNGVFPSSRALVEGGYAALEEERRLAYVAFTRAKKLLYLTLCSDFSYVLGGSLTPSQFLIESGNNIANVREERYGSPFNKPKKPISYHFDDGEPLSFESDEPRKQDIEPESNGLTEADWKVGDIVLHKTLGKGKVISLDGDDIITVDFEEHGEKTILSTHPFVRKGGHEA